MTRASLGIVAAAIVLCTGAGSAQPRDSATGEWQGDYVCAQGSTGLTLSIAPAAPPRGAKRSTRADAAPVTALFRFYPVDANPSVPRGCFEMSGTVAPAARKVELTAGRWLLHPDGYVTVDLSGRISSDGTTFDGAVYGPDCTSFALRRLPGPRASGGVAACHGEAVTASAQ